ncbi:hypothetical protein NQZ68_009926 [Dissostichus eleginoides]|nr:hypothetical protein NQZ68_009926 [Dissostichus eleginoides]
MKLVVRTGYAAYRLMKPVVRTGHAAHRPMKRSFAHDTPAARSRTETGARPLQPVARSRMGNSVSRPQPLQPVACSRIE